MGTAVLLVVALLLPTLLFGAVIGLGRAYRRYQAGRPGLPVARPVTAIVRDLRRLREQLEDIENAPADTPAKNARCRAVRGAYLDVLTDACVQFDIPVPAGRPVPDTEIWRAESELRYLGVDVRRVA